MGVGPPRSGAALACLLLVLSACSRTSSPAPAPPDPCRRLVVAPGAGPIAWTVTAQAAHEQVDSAPVGVGDGFLVSVGDPARRACIGFVEPDGRLRWTIVGRLVDAVRIGGVVVVATEGPHSTTGVDPGTGATLWAHEDFAAWRGVAGAGEVAMLSGAYGVDGSVMTVEAPTGRIRASRFPDRGVSLFTAPVADGGLLVAGGDTRTQGVVVATDSGGRVVLEAPAGLVAPRAVGVAGDVIVLQSSGADGAEPTTHLVGVNRTGGAERWRRVLAGPAAGKAVEVGGVVVVRLAGAVVGLDAGTGGVRWQSAMAGNHDFPVVPVGTDTAVSGGQDEVALFDVTDGSRRWSTRTDGPVAALGILGDVIVVASAPGTYRALRASDGVAQWTVPGPATGPGRISEDHARDVAVVGDTAAFLSSHKAVIALRRAP